MNDASETARNFRPVASPVDIRPDAPVMRILPAAARPYAELMRLDRPIGTWLLLLPGWWSIAMAAGASGADGPGFWTVAWYFLAFGIGAVLMRGAGCTWNDITDRDFDAKVARTATRPIASGQVSVKAALLFLGAQMLAALTILLSFNGFAVLLGAGSLLLVFLYPLAKRVTHWPQAVLGLTFNWGALLGWAAVMGELALAPILLYAAGFFWTLGYDTIYAHQDKEDDAIVGVKSSALALGERTRPFLWIFYGIALSLMTAALIALGAGWPAYIGLAVGAGHLAWQAATVDIHDPADCLAKFRSNRVFGWILLAGLAASGLPAAV
jgi:4-hydroxybenzoate polyprenyltransferase